MSVRCLRCGLPLDTETFIARPVITDEMLARAITAYAQAAGDPHEQADHDNAMREAIAAALDIEP